MYVNYICFKDPGWSGVEWSGVQCISLRVLRFFGKFTKKSLYSKDPASTAYIRTSIGVTTAVSIVKVWLEIRGPHCLVNLKYFSFNKFCLSWHELFPSQIKHLLLKVKKSKLLRSIVNFSNYCV